MIIGCAQWGGDNPLGITGGSYGGYGQDNDINLQNPTNSNTLDPALLGEWINNITRSNRLTITFGLVTMRFVRTQLK
jgi:hypothetical protein